MTTLNGMDYGTLTDRENAILANGVVAGTLCTTRVFVRAIGVATLGFLAVKGVKKVVKRIKNKKNKDEVVITVEE